MQVFLGTRVLASVAAAVVLAAGCGSGIGRREVAGGCGATRLYRGPLPSWIAHSNPPTGVPYAIAARGTAAAFIFGYPLRAGAPAGARNKVLWILRRPGSALLIDATQRAGTPVRITLPDSSGPEIYPSYVNVPRGGCWHLALRWAGHSDSVDLAYRGSVIGVSQRSAAAQVAVACPLSRAGGPRPPAVALQNFGMPIGHSSDPGWFGNGVLWTQLRGPRQTGRDPKTGLVTLKFPWFRARPGRVVVRARRLDAGDSRFSASVGTSAEYGSTGFAPSILHFGAPGCWQLIAQLDQRTLRVTISVPSPSGVA